MANSPFPPKSGSKLKVPELSDKTFGQARKGLALVQMRADWCGYCPEVSEIIDEIASKQICTTDGRCISFFRLDIDKAPKITNKLKIEGVPTVLFLKDGKEIGRVMGTDKAAIRRHVKKLLKK